MPVASDLCRMYEGAPGILRGDPEALYRREDSGCGRPPGGKGDQRAEICDLCGG